MKRILSGMQPTNNLHLGNYLGALMNWVKLQDEGAECLYMVADLHAITVPQDPAALAKSTREIAAAFIASGIDPKKSPIFVQSAVPSHSELMWLLSTIAQMGKLERMTQFKDKAGGKNAERAALGLFAYPVLMAADILVYKATHVPVGEDQRQHLELARDVVGTFNAHYGAFFTMPEPMITGPAPRVMSLHDGSKKMSKSDELDNSRINLTDDADTIAKKIKKATTDPHPLPENLNGFEGRAAALNLVTIYAALADRPIEDVIREFAGKQFSVFKPALADLAVAKLSPITKRMGELMADPGEIDRTLKSGNEKARGIAEPVVQQVRDRMGFWKQSEPIPRPAR